VEDLLCTRTAQLRSRLVSSDKPRENLLNKIQPSQDITKNIEYSIQDYERHIENLEEIENFVTRNLYVKTHKKVFDFIRKKLDAAYNFANFELELRNFINQYFEEINEKINEHSKQLRFQTRNFRALLTYIKQYTENYFNFEKILQKIANYNIEFKTQEKESMGHKLSIENQFTLTPYKFLEVLNKLLKKSYQLNTFEEIVPEALYIDNFKKDKSHQIKSYKILKDKIFEEFNHLNKKTYKIVTKHGVDYDKLSAGWKTSVLLDIILGYDGDCAPLIIDQPEDNLASHYINYELINTIKEIKNKKQIILVSHNATIPMLGDAQNVILCKSTSKKIEILSSPLEGAIHDKHMVDYIAEITDGGKSSIKKRVKKYNLKQYRE
jgi:hypothetical protein